MAVIPFHTMQVVCCYCHNDLERKPCDAKMAGQVSHGVCKACDKKLRERLGLAPERKTLLDVLKGDPSC